jgi:hypothetical protein
MPPVKIETITANECAEILGVKRPWITHLIKKKRLDIVWINSQRYHILKNFKFRLLKENYKLKRLLKKEANNEDN